MVMGFVCSMQSFRDSVFLSYRVSETVSSASRLTDKKKERQHEKGLFSLKCLGPKVINHFHSYAIGEN